MASVAVDEHVIRFALVIVAAVELVLLLGDVEPKGGAVAAALHADRLDMEEIKIPHNAFVMENGAFVVA